MTFPPPSRRSTQRRRYQSGQLIDDGDRWCARWREDAIQPDGTVKRVRKWDVLAMKRDCPNKRQAQKLLDDRLRAINSGDYRPVRSETFSGFADSWMEKIMIHHKPSTIAEEKRRIENTLKPTFGAFPMRDITAEVIQAWVSGMKLSPKTVKNRVGILSSMWTTAKLWGYVQHDPFEGLVLPRAKKPKVYQFTAEEVLQIIDAAKGWYPLLLELLAKTGMRPGEAGALRPQDIDGRLVRVRQSVWQGHIQTTKTEESVRDFPITDEFADRLRAHAGGNQNAHGLIFTNRDGNPLNMDHFGQKVLRPILERLGIWERAKAQGMQCSLYGFRHASATELHRRGTPLATIQARMGHSVGTTVTMEHYIDSVSQDELAAADYLDALYSPKTEGTVQ